MEFDQAGAYWNNVGRRVRAKSQMLQNQVRSKYHIEFLRRMLPDRYSPLQPNGNGIQSVIFQS
jgi:putative restriction endonuclease